MAASQGKLPWSTGEDGRPVKTAQWVIRKEKFMAAQRSLTPDELEKQKEQNRTTTKQRLSHAIVYELKIARRWFVEFLADQHSEINADEEFFNRGAPRPCLTILREYARYLARSRVGRVSDQLSVTTINHYMLSVIRVMEREGDHYPPLWEQTGQLYKFVNNELAEQEALPTAAHSKAVDSSEDVTFILSKLYSIKYLNTFSHMRVVLNLTLYMILLIDTCGRGGDIARNPNRPEHMELRWKDVSFYTSQDEQDDSFAVQAIIKIQWAKGQTHDDPQYKEITLPGLLPTHLALQDSLRMLLITAIVNNGLRRGES